MKQLRGLRGLARLLPRERKLELPKPPRELSQPLPEFRTAPDVPAWFSAAYPTATDLEWITWWGLLQNGLQPERDFQYQVPLSGGRTERGGFIVDFLVPVYQVAINPYNVYHHIERRLPDYDRAQRLFFEQSNPGWRMIFIEEYDLRSNPAFFVREALNGNDYSRIGNRF